MFFCLFFLLRIVFLLVFFVTECSFLRWWRWRSKRFLTIILCSAFFRDVSMFVFFVFHANCAHQVLFFISTLFLRMFPHWWFFLQNTFISFLCWFLQYFLLGFVLQNTFLLFLQCCLQYFPLGMCFENTCLQRFYTKFPPQNFSIILLVSPLYFWVSPSSTCNFFDVALQFSLTKFDLVTTKIENQ